jgi:hypothetical protein
VRSVRPGLVVDELPNNAMEPSARELTLARRGSSLTLGRHEIRSHDEGDWTGAAIESASRR